MSAFWEHYHQSDPATQNFLSQMVEETRKRRLDNLYWYSKVVYFTFSVLNNVFKNCIQAYEDMPEMHSGKKEDLHEYNNYTKQRVADLESDIKERFRITRDKSKPLSKRGSITSPLN